ncbi:hypothetical protein [Clostridium sp.]|uniref:hypothetical protein n=1 Tax=Clostridium sp. TaxID=1506 RepID=UPI003F2A95DF
MIKKYLLFLVSIVGLLIVLLVFKSNTNLEIYKFNVIGTDLMLENYTLVSNGNEVYISDAYSISTVGQDKDITDISLIVKNNETILTDLIFQFPNDKIQNAQNDIIIKENLNDKTSLKILFKYKLNNVQKEDYYSVNLEDKKK